MIPPHTPSGTLVVCVKQRRRCPLPRLCLGRVYTVDEIVDGVIDVSNRDYGDNEFGVALVETLVEHHKLRFEGWKLWRGRAQWFYPLDEFDLAVLPKSITELLVSIDRKVDA